MKRFLLITMMAVFCKTVFSQESGENVLRLSLREAQEHALQNNRTMWNANLSVSEAQRRTWEVISAGLPQINASVDYSNMLGFEMNLLGMGIPMVPTSNFQATVTQLLFSASYWVGIRMSRIGEQMTETARLQAELDIRHQIQSAYQMILIVEKNRRLLEQNLGHIQTLAQSTENMVRVGVAEQTDADRLNIQVSTMLLAIQNVDRNIEMAYNLLRFHLGVDSRAEIVLTETLEQLFAVKDTDRALNMTLDLNTNHNMQLIEGQVELANKQISLQRAASLPTVAIFYNYTYRITEPAFSMTPDHVIGFQASIPIFASGQRHARTQQARIGLEIAQNNRDLVANQLLMQENQLRFNLRTAVETFELQRTTVELSQRVFENVSRRYEQGMASVLDVTIANTELLQAQTNYINAMMQVFSAQSELERLLGITN
ncbi:MAG: TolC family protein [Bacteroidales bacterium]|nr:TolC family protein [Bacteroidales bacterium]